MLLTTFLLLFFAVNRARATFDEEVTFIDNPLLHNVSLVERQVNDGGPPAIVSDPNHPPTLIYFCAMIPEICNNIVDRLQQQGQQAPDAPGIYTTTLHYAPQQRAKNNLNSCGRASAKNSFTNQCKYFYSCDRRRPIPFQMRLECDEFPFASSQEGGQGANVRCVPGFEQRIQGNLNQVVGQYAADEVNGQVVPWNKLPKDDSFAKLYSLSVIFEPLGGTSARMYGQYIVTGTDDVEHTTTKIAAQDPLPTGLQITTTYDHDTSTFKYNSKTVKCSCPESVTTSCETCIPTQRPPFNGQAPDGPPPGARQQRRSVGPQPTPAPHFDIVRRAIHGLQLPVHNTKASSKSNVKRILDSPSVAGLIARLRLEKVAPMLVKRQDQDSCDLDEEPDDPESESEDAASDAQDNAEEAQEEANNLPASNPQKNNALNAAQKAAAAAQQAMNFLYSFVGPAAVTSAASAALAAAAALDRSVDGIDPIYSLVTSAADEANSVVSVASAHPSDFPNTCTTDYCSGAPSTTDSDGNEATYTPPPPPVVITTTNSDGQTISSTLSTGPTTTTNNGGGGGGPTGTPGANGCFVEGESRIWGVRVPHTRPDYSCYEDFTMQVEAISDSKRVRLSTVLNGNKGYASWTPTQQDCGEVNFIQLIPTSYDTALTMEWSVDECGADGGARVSPYWNGSPFPNFQIDLLNLLPVGSPDQDALQCYRDSLSVTTYDDGYFTMLPRGASDPVAVCSDKYPQSTANASAAARVQARPTATQSDPLLQKASQWPTALMRSTPTTMAAS